jgi:hypothetical protein
MFRHNLSYYLQITTWYQYILLQEIWHQLN